jgi:L-ectoine synthase
MIVRNISDVEGVSWGNGISRRFLTARDKMGYTLTDTVVNAGSKSPIQYKNHFEACYCISGSGMVIDAEGNEYPITPGSMYALDKNDPHYLIASPLEDMRLICVFCPALVGDEQHDFSRMEFSKY